MLLEPKYLIAAGLILEFEEFRAKPYYDMSGMLSIGYGRTLNVTFSTTTTEHQELIWLYDKLEKINKAINFCTVPNLNAFQMAALLDFCYNFSVYTFAKSTLVKRLNAGDPNASEEFLRWNKVDGLVIPGLVRRRKAEKALFDAL